MAGTTTDAPDPEEGLPGEKGKQPPRPRGDGGLRWSEGRQRWIAEITVGYTPAGKRIVRSASDRSKTRALKKLHAKLRDRDDGLPSEDTRYTVRQAVEDWLEFGLAGRAPKTVTTWEGLARNHIIPDLGARKLRELSADDVDRWLASKAKILSTKTLRELVSILKRAVARAQARERVRRNVVLLCEVPKGQPGRPSKSLTFDQAVAFLDAAAADGRPDMHAYVSVSMLTGARTEEMRALRWSHVVAYDAERQVWVPVDQAGWNHKEFAVYVWRADRHGEDTKTERSRRSLKLPARCVSALHELYSAQTGALLDAGGVFPPSPDRLVFPKPDGRMQGPMDVLRAFRKVADRAGLEGSEWTTRELRHTFVSLLSDNEMPIEDIARLVGHSSTRVTETVYRHQLRPVLESGATQMDRIFPEAPS
ncbi:tyrosine-type recombinase/integrase [Spirillospora sp. NPDC048823]|uniref:tyrosine-type recombinase/integrase n=1 Tax=unclassified Spirillospora TaxID=2642701 RepID=UPI00371D3DDB